MTTIDISPEAVERLACILEGRGGFVKDSTITATLRALSAALTLHQNDANYQCRERVKEWERANAAELALTKSRAETAVAEARGMCMAAEICSDVAKEREQQIQAGKNLPAHAVNVPQQMRWSAGKLQAQQLADAILAAVPQGEK